MLTGFAAHDFGGLDLASAPDEARCIDLWNIDFDVPGGIRTRDGSTTFFSGSGSFYGCDSFYTAGGTKQIVGIRGSTIEAVSSAAASVATQAMGATYTQPSFVRFAAPGNERMYVAGCTTAGAAPTSFWRWTGGAFTAISPASSNPAIVGLHPTDNRLAFANYASGYSKVNFSDAGNPETFGANNYVEVTPGDGEPIRAMATWGNLLIVFKETKFFVFYGASTDSAGNPVFNYRTIANGVGAVGSRAVAVAPEGVYFCSRDGIYLTSGGSPVRISDPVEPIFFGEHPRHYFSRAELDHSRTEDVAMHYFRGRLYVGFNGTDSTEGFTLVYYPQQQKFTLWSYVCKDITDFRIGLEPEIVFASGTANVFTRHSPSYTTDGGSALRSWYRTGFDDFGTDDEKRLVESRLFGSGTVQVGYSRDFFQNWTGDGGDPTTGGVLTYNSAVTLGTAPDVDQAVARGKWKDGRLFSVQFGNTSGQFRVHRCHHEFQSKRPASTHSR